MKCLLHLMTRLYPASWRKRCGCEFAALLDDADPRFTDAIDLLNESLMARLAYSKTIGASALPGALWDLDRDLRVAGPLGLRRLRCSFMRRTEARFRVVCLSWRGAPWQRRRSRRWRASTISTRARAATR
jgi:hypothetical protein